MAVGVDEIIAFSMYPLCPFGFVLISNPSGPFELAHHSRHIQMTDGTPAAGTVRHSILRVLPRLLLPMFETDIVLRFPKLKPNKKVDIRHMI